MAVAALTFCCLLWGWSFPAAQFALAPFEDQLRQVTPYGHGDFPVPVRIGLSATFNGWRFALAAVAYAAVTFRRQRGFARDEVCGGAIVAFFFTAGMLVQNVGLRYTLPSVSGFLTALLVVFAPLAQAFFLRRPVGRVTWMAVGLALLGALLLAQAAPAAAAHTMVLAAPWPWFGEGMTILGAMFFTGQVLAVDYYGSRVDAARLTLVMFGATAVLSGALGAALHTWPVYRVATFQGLAARADFWWTMGTLVVFSSVVALHLMNVYQPRVSPAMAGVIYCLEPVFAVVFSVLLATERLTVMVALGGAIILAAVLLVARAGPPPDAA